MEEGAWRRAQGSRSEFPEKGLIGRRREAEQGLLPGILLLPGLVGTAVRQQRRRGAGFREDVPQWPDREDHGGEDLRCRLRLYPLRQ